MGTARTVLALAALTLAAGCSTDCQELAERICSCQPEGATRDNCKAQVKTQLERDPKPSSADEAFCASRLETCPSPGSDPGMCDRLNTCEGKVACGLAYDCPPPP